MNKSQIIEAKLALIHWCESLKGLTDEIWFKPFKEGSWGTADVISHFISWDQFLLDYRIPYLIKSEKFPAVKVDVNAINAEAAKYARSGISRNELIDEFKEVRRKLVSLMETIPEERFHESIQNGAANTLLSDYFTGLIEHDQKHRDQIDAFLKNN